ncbi:MAG: tetratricopeptide repeat protein [Pyrinomonadaceae bacterium]
MKKCPQCGREYDVTMMFCLDDGTELLYGPAASEPPAVAGGLSQSSDNYSEPATAILSGLGVPPLGGSSSESPTVAQVHTTDQTAILQPPATAGGSDSSEKQSFSANRAAKPLIAVVAAVILAVGGFFGYKYFSPAKQINSIAVMPFENRNSDADTDYLSDGLAESVIFRLTQIPDLRVSPTSSVMRYKGASTDVAKIASELGVDAVMTGRLTKRGDNLNITVELVDARTNKSLWGEQYERKLSELLTTQREIVTEIVGKLQLKLSGESEQKLAKKYTDNNEAYQLYLQGRFLWNKRTGASLKQAVEFYKQAIEKDPRFALAYAGLADAYVLFPDWADVRPKDVMPQAKQAALKALELDPNLAEAHSSLALIKLYYEYDWAGAEQGFKRAIELNPKYPTARQWYANLLASAGRTDEGLREYSKAAELDPFSKIIIWNLGDGYLYAGRYDEAIAQYQKVFDLFSDHRVYVYIGDTFGAQGKYQQAVEAYLKDYRLANEIKPEEIQKLRESYYKGGWETFGRTMQEIEVGRLVARQVTDPNAHVQPIEFVYAYCHGKDKDKTIEYLNKAYEERSADLRLLKIDVPFGFLRDDPRFKELVKRVGIPE